MDPIKYSRLTVFICLLLAAATLAAFWPVVHHDFINCDDQSYVYENPALQAGLSWAGIAWAFTTGHSGNWHPLTWLSHMLDVQLFGLSAGWHHLTNLLLHVANTLLLFLVLKLMTGARQGRQKEECRMQNSRAFWCSAMVAALFALHPLHVESVAWVAERKDVLSAFFFMLTLWAYSRYAEARSQKLEGRSQKPETGSQKAEDRRQMADGSGQQPLSTINSPTINYLLSLFFFACGLMSKPMLVTLPFVLLLLDYWPLHRLRLQTPDTKLKTVLLEKLPFFVLSAASSVLTFLVQQRAGAVATADTLPLEPRLENAVVSCLLYLAKTVWPSGLAIFYPYRYELSAGMLATAVFVLMIITGLAWVFLRTRPYVAVGWLWFLGMLVPVIGIVQVGQQAMADRYTYLPLVGLFIALVWGGCELLRALDHRWTQPDGAGNPKAETRSSKPGSHRWIRPGGAEIGPFGFWASGFFRISDFGFRICWPVFICGSLVTLFFLSTCLVLTRGQVQHWQDSETLFRHALAATGDTALAHESLGDALAKQGRIEEAETHFAAAVRLKPKYPEALSDLGLARVMRGKLEEGIEYYRTAIAIRPGNWKVHDNLARALCLQGKFDEAVGEYRTVLELEPGATDARGFLAAALVQLGRTNEAGAVFEDALRLKPNDAAVHFQYASLLLALGQAGAAARHFQAALQYAPSNAEAHRRYGLLLLGSGKTPEAIEQFREALRLQPGVEAHYNLATALLQQGRAEEAVGEYRESLRLKPDSPAVLNDLAWLLAASARDGVRNGAEAVILAERACQLTQFGEPLLLGTLAAAYAEAGRFEEAVKTAGKAQELAAAAGLKELADRNRQLLELYRAGKPYHEPKDDQRQPRIDTDEHR